MFDSISRRLLPVAAVLILTAAPASADQARLDFNGDSWGDGLVDVRSSDLRNTRLVDSGMSDSGLEVTIPAGSFRGLGALDRLPQSVDEAWFRYHINLTNFDARSSGKLPGLSGLYSSTARGCFASRPGAPGWSARGLFGAAGSYGAPDGEIPIGSYVYHLNQPGRCGEAIFWDDTSLEADKWYCIEGYVRMNTPGRTDGVVKGWLDSSERFSRSDFEFRRPNEGGVGIRELWLDVYFGGRRPTSNRLNLLIDEIDVSTTGQIGCVESLTNVVSISGSGRAGIATYEPGTGNWMLNQFSGTGFVSLPVANYRTTSKWASHLVGDFGGDGVDDIASYHPENGTWWVSRSGEYGFVTSQWATFSTRTGWGSHITGDFNGDGLAEIASFNLSNGTWWISSPSSTHDVPPVPESATEPPLSTIGSSNLAPASQITFELSSGEPYKPDSFGTALWDTFSTATGWTDQIAGDFNGDGLDDIANYHAGSGNWWVSISTGVGFNTGLWDRFGTNRGWSNHVAGDFDGDGRDDIASYHPATGRWWVSTSTGTGFTTTPWGTFNTTKGWGAQLVGDFDGDGKDDIANYHPTGGTWWVSRSTGTNFVTEHWGTFSTTSGWDGQIAGDFNGDGRDDIANYHPESRTWWVSQSTGTDFATAKWAG